MDLTVDEAAAALASAGTFRFNGGAHIESIRRVEKQLGQVFPSAYVVWLLKYGGGGAKGQEISGVYDNPDDDSPGTVLGDTIAHGQRREIPDGVLVILASPNATPICIQTTADEHGGFPVVEVSAQGIRTLYAGFDEFFADYVVSFAQDVGRDLRTIAPDA